MRGRRAVTTAAGFALVLAGASGCAVMLAGGAAGSAAVAGDPRTTGTFIEDQAIELKALKLLAQDTELRQQTHVGVTSYNQVVLLTGQAPTEALRQRVVALVRAIDKVRHVHDEIAIGAPSSMATRTNDSYITTKVKTRLLGTEALGAIRIKVVTEAGSVFLMGLLSAPEAELAARVASETGGVLSVVKLFEYR